jgi:hypothetical protein
MLTVSGHTERRSLFEETVLDPEVRIEDPEDPTSARYPVVLQLDLDVLLRLENTMFCNFFRLIRKLFIDSIL